MTNRIVMLQISDLHFAADLWNAKGSRIHKIHEGYDAHNVQLCQALDQFVHEDIFRFPGISGDDRFYLLVNGDLTAVGKDDEFDTARRYLFGTSTRIEHGFPVEVGLGHSQDRYLAVPGNHDHWHGQFVPPLQRGYSSTLFPDHFCEPPWVIPLQSGNLEFVFCGVDSNSIFEDTVLNINPGAGGGFSERHRELAEQSLREAMTAEPAEGVKRRTGVILCHHPLSHDGTAPLRDACASWLLHLAAKYNMPFIFTGHTHRSWADSLLIPTTNGLRFVGETRSPTTLQHPAQPDAERRRPGFWLHQISLVQQTIIWTSHLFLFVDGAFRWKDDQPWFRRQI